MFEIGYEKEYRQGNPKCLYCGHDRFTKRCTCHLPKEYHKPQIDKSLIEVNNKGICIKCGTHLMDHGEVCQDEISQEKTTGDAREILREMELAEGEKE